MIRTASLINSSSNSSSSSSNKASATATSAASTAEHRLHPRWYANLSSCVRARRGQSAPARPWHPGQWLSFPSHKRSIHAGMLVGCFGLFRVAVRFGGDYQVQFFQQHDTGSRNSVKAMILLCLTKLSHTDFIDLAGGTPKVTLQHSMLCRQRPVESSSALISLAKLVLEFLEAKECASLSGHEARIPTCHHDGPSCLS